ncbi:hypothetical protein HMPREF1634_03720 [Tissierellia bacterium S7-1-4]|nr:hypothetical protein HMPREF1634_03720 [Tissierellia bacterium S7-1-4]
MKKRITFLAILMTFTMVFTMSLKAASFVDEMKAVKSTPAKLGEFVSKFNLKVPNEKGELKDYKFKYAPKVVDNKSALAVTDVLAALGKKVYWDKDNRLAVINNGDKGNIIFPVDKKAFYLNGKLYALDVPATIDAKEGRTYLPLRTLCDALGYEVKWDNKTKVAEVKPLATANKLEYKAIKDIKVADVDAYIAELAKKLNVPELAKNDKKSDDKKGGDTAATGDIDKVKKEADGLYFGSIKEIEAGLTKAAKDGKKTLKFAVPATLTPGQVESITTKTARANGYLSANVSHETSKTSDKFEIYTIEFL